MPIFRRFVTVSPLRLLLLSHHLRHVHLPRHLFVDLLLKELDLLECSFGGGALSNAVVPAHAAERALAHHRDRHADLSVHRALGTPVRETQHNNVKIQCARDACQSEAAQRRHTLHIHAYSIHSLKLGCFRLHLQQLTNRRFGNFVGERV